MMNFCKIVPVVDSGFGPWENGTAVPGFPATVRHGATVARRMARLYRVEVRLYVTPYRGAAVSSERHSQIVL